MSNYIRVYTVIDCATLHTHTLTCSISRKIIFLKMPFYEILKTSWFWKCYEFWKMWNSEQPIGGLKNVGNSGKMRSLFCSSHFYPIFPNFESCYISKKVDPWQSRGHFSKNPNFSKNDNFLKNREKSKNCHKMTNHVYLYVIANFRPLCSHIQARSFSKKITFWKSPF